MWGDVLEIGAIIYVLTAATTVVLATIDASIALFHVTHCPNCSLNWNKKYDEMAHVIGEDDNGRTKKLIVFGSMLGVFVFPFFYGLIWPIKLPRILRSLWLWWRRGRHPTAS
jgi:hypothetical protein